MGHEDVPKCGWTLVSSRRSRRVDYIVSHLFNAACPRRHVWRRELNRLCFDMVENLFAM